MIIDTRRCCIDCDHGPIITMVCDSCSSLRVERDGKDWFRLLCEDFERIHPDIPIERARKEARGRRQRQTVYGWNGEVLASK